MLICDLVLGSLRFKFMLSVQSIFKKIVTVAKKEDTPVYVVGGFVRDYLMDVDQKKDLDFVVVGSGLEFAKNLTVPLKKLEVWWNFPSLIRRGMFGEKGRNKLFWNLRGEKRKI